MEWLIYIGPAAMRQQELEEIARDWYRPIELALFSNPTLNGTAVRFGFEDDNEDIQIRAGQIHLFSEGDQNADKYVGIEVTIPVTTKHSYTQDIYQ